MSPRADPGRPIAAAVDEHRATTHAELPDGSIGAARIYRAEALVHLHGVRLGAADEEAHIRTRSMLVPFAILLVVFACALGYGLTLRVPRYVALAGRLTPDAGGPRRASSSADCDGWVARAVAPIDVWSRIAIGAPARVIRRVEPGPPIAAIVSRIDPSPRAPAQLAAPGGGAAPAGSAAVELAVTAGPGCEHGPADVRIELEAGQRRLSWLAGDDDAEGSR